MSPPPLMAAWLASTALGGLVAPPADPLPPPELVFALPAPAPEAAGREPAAITATFGLLEVLDSDVKGVGGFELRMPEVVHDVQPMLGLVAAEDESWYAYAGLRWNLDLSERWRLAPGFAMGHFEMGDELSLGSSLEFRSSIERSRSLGARWRLGLEFYHLSNSSIDDINPGTEGLVLNWSYALD